MSRRAGEPVSKEDLLQTIWPGTFVSDDALKRCIFELRRVFEDDPREPRIIATIPKRGYRLIATVSRNGNESSPSTIPIEIAATPTQKRKFWLALVVGVFVIGVTGAFLWRSRQPNRLTEKDVVVLGDFVNSTGDAVFDGTLRRGLAVQLEQSPFLKLLPEEQIQQTLRMMGQKQRASHAGNQPGSLSAKQQCSGAGRLHRPHRRPVRGDPQGGRLRQGRFAGKCRSTSPR